MSDITEAIEEAVEEAFPPKPGGLISRHREREAMLKATEEEARHADEPIEQRAYKSVKVAEQSPETFTAQTVTILPGATAMIAPNNPYRYRSVIMLQTSGASAVLAKDNGAAIASNGFLIGAFQLIDLRTRAQIVAFNNTTETTIQISVLSEIYAPEK
jgi:hypothetical protein